MEVALSADRALWLARISFIRWE